MKDYAAVFDIGSNAVRLVIYGGSQRAPVKIHQERNLCALGAGLAETGRLNPVGTEQALDSLKRFSGLVASMKIRRVHAVATAAVRDAEDGPAFMKKVKKTCGLDIAVITGEEEARLSAQGVLMNGLGAEGLIGDYGGGSLELIMTDGRRIRHRASLPVGAHRLNTLLTRKQKVTAIETTLDGVPFLNDAQGQDFTALGGAWRSMARAHMHFSRYPLRVLDHYAIDGARGMEFAGLLSRQSPASLEKTVGLASKRAQDAGTAGLVMECLFTRLKPRRLVFSATGLREGLLFDRLSPAARAQDALLAGCEHFALRTARFKDTAPLHALAEWAKPLFGPELHRRVDAACLLSDIAGFAHEDWQAQQAFQQILTFPFYGADHADRAFLALALYARYKGYLRRTERAKDDPEHTHGAQRVLGPEGVNLAVQCGLAMRTGWLLTGGALGLLKHAPLNVMPERVEMRLKPKAAALNAEAVRKAFDALGAASGRTAKIVIARG